MRAIWTFVCVIGICSLALGHSNNTIYSSTEHGNNPRLTILEVEFPITNELSSFLDATGLVEQIETGAGCGDTFLYCANNTEGAWPNERSWCIEMYLCAYYLCVEECPGSMQYVCIDNARYSLYACSGIDLMVVGGEWGTDHDTTIEILRELYDI